VVFLLRNLTPASSQQRDGAGSFFGLDRRDIRKLTAINVVSVNELKIALKHAGKRPPMVGLALTDVDPDRAGDQDAVPCCC